MSIIKIKNFGPIKTGFTENQGFMDINKITVFIGSQGSGKSTIAKLISTFSWLEKALRRGELKMIDLTFKQFKDKHCAYQNIHNYFKAETEIEYKGIAFSFICKDEDFSVTSNKPKEYLVPKIMYIPAERNFVSSVDKPDKLKYLPNPLITFLTEFLKAQENIKDNILLPINDTTFEFDRIDKIANIKGKGYKVRLSEASSGFQSSVPLFLVSRSLALFIDDKDKDASKKETSVEDEKRLRTEIRKIIENDKLSESLKKAALEELSAKYTSACFLNIVEEPEQNLYPTSQKNILFELIKYANLNDSNKLLITTHSPYIINYLTIAIKANYVFNKINKSNNQNELKTKLDEIIPITSMIVSDRLAIYELDNNGKIVKLGKYNGLPSDENFLNDKLAESNELFSNLLEIEDLCK